MPASVAAFDQFELVKTLVPDEVQVGDRYAGTGANRSGMRAGRQVGCACCITHGTHRKLVTHAYQRIARVQAKPDCDSVAGMAGFFAVFVPNHHCIHTTVIALKTQQCTGYRPGRHALRRCADADHHAEIDPCRVQLSCGPRGHDAGQLVPGRNRLNFSGSGGNNDLLIGMCVQKSMVGTGHDEWSGIDADDFLAGGCVECHNMLALCFGRSSGRAAGVAQADHNYIALDVARRDRYAGAAVFGQRWIAGGVVTLDDHARSRFDLAGADIGDAVHSGETMGAVACQTETAASGRVVLRTQHGDECAVAFCEIDGNSVDNESRQS